MELKNKSLIITLKSRSRECTVIQMQLLKIKRLYQTQLVEEVTHHNTTKMKNLCKIRHKNFKITSFFSLHLLETAPKIYIWMRQINSNIPLCKMTSMRIKMQGILELRLEDHVRGWVLTNFSKSKALISSFKFRQIQETWW